MSDKVAVVTGAARGIGAAVAAKLAADGLAVAVVDLDESACKDTVDRIVSAGGKAIGVGADVSDAAAVQAASERAGAAAETSELEELTSLVYSLLHEESNP